jgi:16S rRNA processing protein RimM
LTERFTAGLIGAPFGLKGFVKVKPLSGEPDHLLALKSVVLRQNNTEKTIKIEETAGAFPSVLVKFEGFDSPEAAKSLCGAELLVDRAQAAPLKDGEFYIEDLKGLAVVDIEPEDSEIIGYIADIIEGGGNSLAEIRLTTGETRLVPFRNEFFGEIDLEKGRVELLRRWILE